MICESLSLWFLAAVSNRHYSVIGKFVRQVNQVKEERRKWGARLCNENTNQVIKSLLSRGTGARTAGDSDRPVYCIILATYTPTLLFAKENCVIDIPAKRHSKRVTRYHKHKILKPTKTLMVHRETSK